MDQARLNQNSEFWFYASCIEHIYIHLCKYTLFCLNGVNRAFFPSIFHPGGGYQRVRSVRGGTILWPLHGPTADSICWKLTRELLSELDSLRLLSAGRYGLLKGFRGSMVRRPEKPFEERLSALRPCRQFHCRRRARSPSEVAIWVFGVETSPVVVCVCVCVKLSRVCAFFRI